MGDIPAGWLALAGLLISAVGTVGGFFFKYQQKQIDAADARAAASNLKYETLLLERIEEEREQRRYLMKRSEADAEQALTDKESIATLVKLAAKVQPT